MKWTLRLDRSRNSRDEMGTPVERQFSAIRRRGTRPSTGTPATMQTGSLEWPTCRRALRSLELVPLVLATERDRFEWRIGSGFRHATEPPAQAFQSTF